MRGAVATAAWALALVISSAVAASGQERTPRAATATAGGVRDPDGTIRFPSLRVSPKAGVIEVDGRVCLQSGLLEVVACTSYGKVHESLLVVDCRPTHLHAALLLLGLVERPGQVPALGEGGALAGDRVAIDVTWTGPGGATVTSRVEDMLLDTKDGTTMPRVGFVFTGSRFIKVGDREVFGAHASGQIVTVYHDPDAILDNPLAKGADDTTYHVNSSAVPAAGTPVTLRLRRRSEDEPVPPPTPVRMAPAGQGRAEPTPATPSAAPGR